MITRYSVIFAAQSVEPDHRGEWVKYEDYERETNALKGAGKDHSAQLSALEKANKTLAAELEQVKTDQAGVIVRQSQTIKAARERLQLHDHTPNCESRVGVVEPDGSERVRGCNCGLDQWMKESGVAYG